MSSLFELMTLKSVGIFCLLCVSVLFIISFKYKEGYRKNLLISISFFGLNLAILFILENENKLYGLHEKILNYSTIFGIVWFVISYIYGMYVTIKKRKFKWRCLGTSHIYVKFLSYLIILLKLYTKLKIITFYN